MKSTRKVRVRPSLYSLSAAYYDGGDKRPLENLMRAWKGIKELPPEHPQSFFQIGGLHGEPFRGAGWGSTAFWGGYCNHGNVLFPTWHRVYIYKLEQALQSIPGCRDVMLPYWDVAAEDQLTHGTPRAVTERTFRLDGVDIPNPLRSYVLPKRIADNISTDNPNYSKPAGYETVRYPMSGLVGDEKSRAATKLHNAKYKLYGEQVSLMNQNLHAWLTSSITVGGKTIPTNVVQKFKDSLDAPNYTVFSNKTSSTEWNDWIDEGAKPVMSLEEPHNNIHLAVGGCDVPGYDRSPIAGANADMGENDTASFDPIFYLHHCNIDRIFWLWQKKHGCTDRLEIIPEYPGTNSSDNQGPTPGVAPNSWLTMDSPLAPFRLTAKGADRPFTSRDCVNIERQLGYTYTRGTLDEQVAKLATVAPAPAPMVRVSGINRAPIRGSFIVAVYAKIGGKKMCLGHDSVLSRWNVRYCANCQTHLEVKAHFGLHGIAPRLLKGATYEVAIHGRDGLLTAPAQAKKITHKGKKLYRLEVGYVPKR